MTRFVPRLNVGLVRASVHTAREVLPYFGRHAATTHDAVRLLERWGVETVLAELPAKYAAVLSPLLLGRYRTLTLATHVPALARRLVQLHEGGHLCQGTAEWTVAYDRDDWTTTDEQAADAFAAVGLVHTRALDLLIAGCARPAEREDAVLGALLEWAEGLWPAERARLAARNRLLLYREAGL